jgi:hypothetical protein
VSVVSFRIRGVLLGFGNVGRCSLQTVALLSRKNNSRNGEAPERRGGGDTRGPTHTSPQHGYYEGIPRLGAAASDTSYANARASFSSIHHSKKRFLGVRRPTSLALTHQ